MNWNDLFLYWAAMGSILFLLNYIAELIIELHYEGMRELLEARYDIKNHILRLKMEIDWLKNKDKKCK